MQPIDPEAMQAECDAFNAAHRIGAPILVWPGVVGVGKARMVKIREPGAYVLSGHTAVVQVTGGHGCIALSNVDASSEPRTGPAPKFSVIVSERVTVRYHPVLIEAEDYTAAACKAEALRRDGDLGDPARETVLDTSFEVAPHLDTDPAPDAADTQFYVTAAGRAALDQAEA